MSVGNPQKTVCPGEICCGERATLTLSFQAAAELCSHPTDFVLIMDRSASMTEERMEYGKRGAEALIAMVAAASGGGEVLGNGCRMGLVSFSDCASADVGLTQQVSSLRRAIGGLHRGGYTNHRDAFEKAEAMLDYGCRNRRKILMFTDGRTTVGGDAALTARRIRNSGTEIYCIGLTDDPTQLKQWASDPAWQYVTYTDIPAELTEAFCRAGAEAVEAGARDVEIHEQLNPEFQLIRALEPTAGTVQVTGPQTLVWKIPRAGCTCRGETVSLSLEIRHLGTEGGVLPVNRCVHYRDRSCGRLEFPSPVLSVRCSGGAVFPEVCPPPVELHLDSCESTGTILVPDIRLTSLGRIVQVDGVLRQVCPGKRVAVAVVLSEMGPEGEEYPRGFKTFTVPALEGSTCRDVTLRCISFVVPEDLDAGCAPQSLCHSRVFRARVLANYIDTEFACCDAETEDLC